jgi:N-acetylmuramoyl-L-alanine amidase
MSIIWRRCSGGKTVLAARPFLPGLAVLAIAVGFILAIPSKPAPMAVETAVETAVTETSSAIESVNVAEETSIAELVSAENSQRNAPAQEGSGTDTPATENAPTDIHVLTEQVSSDVTDQAPQEAPTSREEASAGRSDQPAKASRGGSQARQEIVAIDPGHGGGDIGANRTFPDGFVIKESDLSLKVSLALASMLKGDGYQVILTRDKDIAVNTPAKDRTGDGRVSVGDELQARLDIANTAKADLFVSVHFNAAANQQGGTEVFYCADRPFSAKSKSMAGLLQKSLLEGLRSLGYESPNRGVKLDTQSAAGTYLYVLGPKTSTIYKPINMPSVLGEALFVSNVTESGLLRNEKTIGTIAEAYYRAIVTYFDGV